MEKEKAKSIIDSYRSRGIQTFRSIDFISDYKSQPFLTDPVMLKNQVFGRKLKRLCDELGIKQIKSDCKVKDSNGNPTTCSMYEITYPNNLPVEN
jgi:hypothetical protein